MTPNQQKPSQGRVVLYRADPNTIWPAFVTHVRNDLSAVDLAVFTNTGTHFELGVAFSENPYAAGTWHWPPRV